MDLTRFEQLARGKSRTRDELETMRANALARGRIECARIADEVLRERFPVRTKKGGGATPTTATKRRGNPSYSAALTGGWFADINRSHQDKFSALLQLSHLSGLEYPTDWNFRVIGGTAELAQQQEMAIRAQELLAELTRL
jgi:hypothetical protein